MILRLAVHAMATRFELVLEGECEVSLRSAGEEAIAIIQEWHARLNRFSKESQLSFINRTAGTRPVPIDEDLFDLLTLCQQVHQASGGAFDPVVPSSVNRPTPVPPSIKHMALDASTKAVSFAVAELALDLGSVAKGLALDRATAILREFGIQRALLHGGTSSIAALGSPSTRPAWRARVESGGEPLLVDLCECHCSISAPQGNIGGEDPGRRGHIFDPRSGEPVHRDRTAVVCGASGTEVEAWSTALAVSGATVAVPPHVAVAIHEPHMGWNTQGGASETLFKVAHIGPLLEVR